jgi:hypothetical protein
VPLATYLFQKESLLVVSVKNRTVDNKRVERLMIMYLYLLAFVTYLQVMNGHIRSNRYLVKGVSLRRGAPSNGHNIL